jgi:NAD-dependent SIR2 family protein deacetylase
MSKYGFADGILGGTINMDEQERIIQENKFRVKKYLSLENVSFLTGAGTSFHLGAPVIRDIPEGLKDLCEEDIKTYFPEKSNPSYEDLFNCLQADRYIKLDNIIMKFL